MHIASAQIAMAVAQSEFNRWIRTVEVMMPLTLQRLPNQLTPKVNPEVVPDIIRIFLIPL